MTRVDDDRRTNRDADQEMLTLRISVAVAEAVRMEFKAFREAMETHVSSCMGQCKAHNMFASEGDRAKFYELANMCRNHFEKHREKNRNFVLLITVVGASVCSTIYGFISKVLGW